jgi:hypothetical protein
MALICAAAGFAYGLVLNFYTFVTFTASTRSRSSS